MHPPIREAATRPGVHVEARPRVHYDSGMTPNNTNTRADIFRLTQFARCAG